MKQDDLFSEKLARLVGQKDERSQIAVTNLPHSVAFESNHVFAVLIFMSRLKSIDFYQNKLKFKLYLQKNTIFSIAAGEVFKPTMAYGGALTSPN